MTLIYQGHVLEEHRRLVQQRLDAMAKRELACNCGGLNALMRPFGSVLSRTYTIEATCECGMVFWTGQAELK